MSSNLRVGFLGAGKMATALAHGFVRAQITTKDSLIASDPMEGARSHFEKEVGGLVCLTNAELAKFASVLILAVKPDHVIPVLEEVRPYLTDHHLVISIAAGVTLKRMQDALFEGARVIRVMPNTPALVGASASAYAMGEWATAEDGKVANRLLSAVGLVYEVQEKLLDAVTGLSGSGPAFAFLIIEALSDGAVAAGLPRELAIKLAAQTLLGSAKMLLETGLHPGALKDMVTSPGGTTIEGVHELERGALRGTLMNAVRAAAEKSKRLGQAQPESVAKIVP